MLFTRHPGQLVIPEDRDFEPLLAAPTGRVELIAIPRSLDGSRASRDLPSITAILTGSPEQWEKMGSYGGLDLYRFTGSPGVACRQGEVLCRKASSWSRPSGEPIS